jgi:hypothetical protein
MSSDMPDYDIGAIRELLTAAFQDKDLRRFCQNRPEFKPIVKYIGSGDALVDMVDMVDKVIDFCETRSLFGELLVEVQPENPRQYDRYAARLIKGAMLPDLARERVREVLAACNRRAIFTEMHAQMSWEAMFASLAH